MEIERAFIDEARTYLTAEYLPKIERCLEKLSDEQIWWRPNEQSNSIGNLILHLVGNITQWIISGVGGAADIRQRDEEFAERTMIARDELTARLRATIDRVDAMLASVDPSSLLEKRTIQGKEQTVLHAIYQVTEHFALHTGQIIYITKLLSEQSMAFYEFVDGVPYGRWMKERGA
jgi:uncharacterized damage-inducible protein DinB